MVGRVVWLCRRVRQRKYNLGVATFIVLERMEESARKAGQSRDERRLIELIV